MIDQLVDYLQTTLPLYVLRIIVCMVTASKFFHFFFIFVSSKKRGGWAGVDHYLKDEGVMAWWRPAYYH